MRRQLYVYGLVLSLFGGKISFGQSRQQLNDSLLNYYKQGDIKKTILFGEMVLPKAKNEFGELSQIYVESLNKLAALYESMGNYGKAEPLYVEAKNIYKKILGEEHPDYTISMNSLGSLYENMGNYGKAELMFMEALNIRKKVLGEEHLGYATSLDNLAGLYQRMGNYSKAELMFMEAKNIRKKKLGEKHLVYSSSLSKLGYLYLSMGNYGKSELMFIEALNISKKVLGKEYPHYAISLINLARSYQSMGNYGKAEPLYVEAKNIYKKILGEEDPVYAISLNSLGLLYQDMDNYGKAEPLYVEAKNIYKKIGGEQHPAYARSLNNLGYLYLSMGNYGKSELMFMEALNISKKVLGEEHPDYAGSLNSLAYLYHSLGNYSKAEPLYVEALHILKKVLGEEHPDYAMSLNVLAALYKSMGNHDKAEHYSIKGSTIGLRHLLANFTNLSEKEKQIWLNKKEYENEFLLSLQYSFAALSDTARQFILNQQMLLKSLILSDSKVVLQIIQNSKDSSLKKIYGEWAGIKKQLSLQYSLPIVNRNKELGNWEKQAEDLEKQLNRRASVFREQQQSLRIRTKDVQKKLNNDETSVEFVSFRLYNKKKTDSTIYAAYIVNKNDSIPIFVPLFEENQLQQLLDSAGKSATATAKIFYRGLELKNKNTVQGRQLYKLIWQPLEPYLKNVKKISYSPAGKLYGIAFHALPVDSTTLLMDKYQLQQYTSTRQVALRNSENKTVNPTAIALFGDANFSMDSLQLTKQRPNQSNTDVSTSIYTPSTRGANNSSWPNLPGTAEEVKKIGNLFNQNKLNTKAFTQTTASEENLKALSGNSPQILHIATHGFFLPEPTKKKRENGFDQGNAYSLADDPLLRSGLILAGGNYAWSGKTPIDGVEDGIATAYEVSQLNLSNTELVVLSACETALGDVKGSEGVFGLQRAFKMAGVKKMIVSLWQVPDKETAELMTSFYTYWMKGKTINDAFTQAQADMRKKYSPFYWAAFVLVE